MNINIKTSSPFSKRCFSSSMSSSFPVLHHVFTTTATSTRLLQHPQPEINENIDERGRKVTYIIDELWKSEWVLMATGDKVEETLKILNRAVLTPENDDVRRINEIWYCGACETEPIPFSAQC